MNHVTNQSSQHPALSCEMAEMARIAHKILNLRVSDQTYQTLVAHGMPTDADPTVGNILEIALARKPTALCASTQRERASWEDWASKLMALYKIHITSTEAARDIKHPETPAYPALTQHIAPPTLPFSRSDFNLLSFSTEIARAIGLRAAGLRDSSLGCACQAELERCESYFNLLSEFALEAGRRLEV